MPKLFVYILLLLASHISVSGTVNYCFGGQAGQDWYRLTVKYNEITELKTIYVLRKTLCDQVKTGETDLSDAIDLRRAKQSSRVRRNVGTTKRILSKCYIRGG